MELPITKWVSTLLTMHGENVVLRLLDRGGRPVGLEELGMAPDTLATMQALARRPHGMILATGRTGSGKTTTLYAALKSREATADKLITTNGALGAIPRLRRTRAAECEGLCLRRATLTTPDGVAPAERRREV